MPEAKFEIVGDIADFGRMDNIFAAFKREAEKALSPWTIKVDLTYEETQGTGEIPK